MKILVCLKQVPHKDARLDVRSDGSWIQDENIKFEINDYDNYALEEALRIKDDGEAEVVVACIGPDRARWVARRCACRDVDPNSRPSGDIGFGLMIQLVAAVRGFVFSRTQQ